MKYFPHLLIFLSGMNIFFHPDNYVPLIVAGVIYVASVLTTSLQEKDIKIIREEYDKKFDDHIAEVSEHYEQQSIIINDQAEIIERLRVSIGFKDIN